jgi:TetR/AcrR family transcriptional regulator
MKSPVAKRTANAKRRREDERQHRRSHILLAAERVFGRRPYDEASMQEVAEEAGIGMKGLYQHFASKEKLYMEVVGFRLAEIDERIKAVGRVDDPLQQLHNIAVAYLEFFLERPQFFPVFATQKLSLDWELGSRFTELRNDGIRQIEAEVQRTLAAGVKAGLLAPADPKLLAAVAIGFFVSATQYSLLVKRPSSAEACVDDLMKFFLTGIGKTP